MTCPSEKVTSVTTTFKANVLAELKKMKDGEVRFLYRHKPNYHRFVYAVKVIIDWGEATEAGMELTFSDDYSRLKKRVINVEGKN